MLGEEETKEAETAIDMKLGNETEINAKLDKASLNILKTWVPSCLPLKVELDQKKRFIFKIYLGLLENLDRLVMRSKVLFLQKTSNFTRCFIGPPQLFHCSWRKLETPKGSPTLIPITGTLATEFTPSKAASR
jgi:hypothetical protein